MPCYKLGLKFGRSDIIKRFLGSERTGFYFAVLRLDFDLLRRSPPQRKPEMGVPYMVKAVLSGRADQMLDPAASTLWR